MAKSWQKKLENHVKGKPGGRREGSGRKKVPGLTRRSITIDLDELKAIDKFNPQPNRSKFYSVAAQKYLAQLKKGLQELPLPG